MSDGAPHPQHESLSHLVRRPPHEERPRPTRVQIALFLLTCFSTFLVQLGDSVGAAVAYSASIVGILLAHEMGHYVACRRHGVPATLPYFLPMPISIFGTLGAVILMRGRIPNRRVLFDIAVAGPIAGLVVAVPVLALGLGLSDVSTPRGEPGIEFGEPLLLRALARLILGALPDDAVIYIHPVGLAGWAGLFVTALNLLPVGQLDGGHVLYAMFGRRVLRVTLPMVGGLAILALSTGFGGWAILAVMIALFSLWRPHPPTEQDEEPLDQGRFVIGVMMLVIFALCFTPRPFRFPGAP